MSFKTNFVAMTRKSIALVASILFLSTTVNAALIDNAAKAAASTIAGGGQWYATNVQVPYLFYQLIPNWLSVNFSGDFEDKIHFVIV